MGFFWQHFFPLFFLFFFYYYSGSFPCELDFAENKPTKLLSMSIKAQGVYFPAILYSLPINLCLVLTFF
jgi:hypothetical protein